MTDRLDEIEAELPEIICTCEVCPDCDRRYLISRVREAEEQFREMVDRLFAEQQEVRRLRAEVEEVRARLAIVISGAESLRAAIGDACRYYPDSGGCAAHPDDTDPCPFCELQERDT